MIALGHPARLALQAAEFLALYGVFGPFAAASPLLQLLLWAGSGLGLSFDSAEAAARIGAYAGGCAAAFALARKLRAEGAAAVWAAAAYCAAPSRLHALLQGGALNELLFWSLAPVCGLVCAGVWRKPAPMRFLAAAAAALVWGGARAWTASLWDLAALVELLLLAGAALYRPQRARRLAAALFSGSMLLLATAPRAPRPPEAGKGYRVAGADDLRVALNPVLAAAHEKALAVSSDGRAGEAILWARAMGARALWAPRRQRFAGLLETAAVSGDAALFDLGGPVAGDAVIVSRRLWEKLPAIRGVYDREALERYLAWADRPESLRVRSGGGRLSIRADLAEADAVLVRIPFAVGWELVAGEGRLAADPVGYTVFAPGADAPLGEMRIEIAPKRFWTGLPEPVPLHAEDFPVIAPGGLTHGAAMTPPPFAAGDAVSIFGGGFLPGDTSVRVDGRRVETLYVGAAQINIALPVPLAGGRHELTVESGGLRSLPRAFEARGR